VVAQKNLPIEIGDIVAWIETNTIKREVKTDYR
jgi:hypothetical protein